MIPADMFTNHSPSRERVESLVKLFGCEYREGRAACAPALRRDPGEGVGYSVNVVSRSGKHTPRELPVCSADFLLPALPEDQTDEEDYGRGVPEAGMHDVDVLPHMHDDDQISELFPRAVADEEECDQLLDYQPSNTELIHGPVETCRVSTAAARSLNCLDRKT